MNRIVTSAVAGASALAIVAMGVAGASGASAYSGTPPWAAGDTASKGSINFFDANGNVITGGANINTIASYLNVSSAGRASATKATLLVAAPDPANALPSTWAFSAAQSNYVWSPTPGSIPTPVSTSGNPFMALNSAGQAIADAASGVTLYSGANASYLNVLELRVQDSGVGAVSDGGKYWRTDIEFNPAGAGSAYDGLAPGAWRVIYPAVSLRSTSVATPTASPVSPQYQGTSVTFSTTVSAGSGSNPANGTVTFFDGATQIGAAKTITSAGQTVTSDATTTLSRTGAFTDHTITAQFIPADYTDLSGSTSSGLTFRVNKSPAATTTTSLALGAASVQQPDAVTATAVVTKDADSSTVTAGTVVFKDGSNTLGTDASAPYTLSVSSSGLSLGSHTVTAEFTPTDATDFVASTSGGASLTITAPAYAASGNNISTSIPAGTIVITTPYTGANTLTLPEMTLDANATFYSTSATFNGIQVADTRAGNLAWTLSALASNLTKSGVGSPGANETINAQNVGLTSLTKTSSNVTPNTYLGGVASGGSTSGQNLTAFDNAGASYLAYNASGTTGLGGASPHAIVHANNGLGTSVFSGTLGIKAPTNTLAGTYTGTVTLTVIGS
ncbi:MAG: Ig-like domain repeat protein [Actinomycetes bacterium]